MSQTNNDKTELAGIIADTKAVLLDLKKLLKGD
jgi:hypothetical protein